MFPLVLLFALVAATQCENIHIFPHTERDNSTETTKSTGSVFECQEKIARLDDDHNYKLTNPLRPMTSFAVLPGYGWDNLRNEPAGQVTQLSYHECRLSSNSRYLIPDNVIFIPDKQSKLDNLAEVIEHWDDYKSATSWSVNVGAGGAYKGVAIDGTFSYDYLSAKSLQHNTQSALTRVQVRHNFFNILLVPSSQLTPAFKQRLLDIAAHIQNNDTSVAEYLGQEVVRDYGTHQITRVIAGAVLVKEDALNSDFVSKSKTDKRNIAAAASASFFKMFSIKASYGRNVSHSLMNAYETNVTHSKMQTYGGPPVTTDFSLDQWTKNLDAELVAIDRSGDPLSDFVNSATLPELPSPTVNEVAKLLSGCIQRYYSYNTYRGCTSRKSPFFNLGANVNDNSCHMQANQSTFTFGGMFQDCVHKSGGDDKICNSLDYKNPLTDAKTCPVGYNKVHLLTHNLQKESTDYNCQKSCVKSGWFFKKTKCSKHCSNQYATSSATTTTYWCAGSGKHDVATGLYFGGLFSDLTENTIMGAKSCPRNFYSLPLGDKIHVCMAQISNQTEDAAQPFAGFYSCHDGNPLVISLNDKTVTLDSNPAAWPKDCPHGYSKHLAGIKDDNCYVYYCVVNVGLDEIPQVRRPPFSPRPTTNAGAIKTLYVQGYAGTVWKKNYQTGQWEIATSPAPELSQASEKTHEDGDWEFGDGAKAGIGVGVAVVCGFVVATVVLKKRKSKKDKKGLSVQVTGRADYLTLQEEPC